MRRRDLLAAGTTGAVCGLAGCIGSTFDRLRSDRPGTGGDESATDSSADTDRTESESRSDETIEVGDPDEVPFLDAHPPHEFELRNEGEAARTISASITVEGNDEGEDDGDNAHGAIATCCSSAISISRRAMITLVLVEPRSYAITVTTSSDDGTSEATVTDGIDRSPFDCTRSRTTLTLSETGTQTESTSTSISCPTPVVADASLEVGERECAGGTDEDGATVEFADETVIVDGDITIPTPCHGLSLAETEYDERRDVLAITVGVGEQEGDTCIDCLGAADYAAESISRGDIQNASTFTTRPVTRASGSLRPSMTIRRPRKTRAETISVRRVRSGCRRCPWDARTQPSGPPRARSRLLVDQRHVVVTDRLEGSLDVLGREREMVNSSTVVLEILRNRSVLDGFEQLEVAVTAVEEDDAHPVEHLLVNRLETEEVVVQRCEGLCVVDRDSGVVEVHRIVLHGGAVLLLCFSWRSSRTQGTRAVSRHLSVQIPLLGQPTSGSAVEFGHHVRLLEGVLNR